MLENFALFSRLLFFIALVCAAVMSFIMCSDAARASPVTTQVDNGVWHNVQRRLHTPYGRHLSLSAGLFPTETGLQTVTGEPLSIIDHQSNLPRFTEGSFGYNQNIPDNKKSHVGITGAQSEVTSASSIFTSHSQHVGQGCERQQSMGNYPPPSLTEVPKRGNSFYSHPVIIRKSSYKETASPFHQSPLSSHFWDPKDAQKSYKREKFPSSYSPTAAKDETVWEPSDFPLFSSQSGRYLSTSLPTSRGHYSDYKETNELAVVRPQSTTSGIQSSKFFSFTSQNARRAPSISNSLGASVIKSNPSLRKLTSSITDFTQGLHSVSNNETPQHKKLQSYLFKDSQASSGGNKIATVADDGPGAFFTSHKQKLSDPHVYGGFSSNFKQLQQSQTKEPPKEIKRLSDDASLQYYDPNVAKYDAQTDSFPEYHPPTTETAAQMSVHPASGPDNTMKNVVRIPNADFQSNYVTGSEESVVSSLVNTTTSGSTHAYKPGRTVKSIYGFQGFRNPVWRAKKEPSAPPSSSTNERTNSNWYSFDKGKFKITNIYPSLSPKYSFGQRKAPTAPAKLERPPTGFPSPPPGTFDMIKTITTPSPFTSGSEETRPLLPESDAGMDNNPDRRRFKIHRKVYGLKGFSSRPLEGTKPPVSAADKPVRGHQRSEGLKLRSSQIWQKNSSRIHGLYNKAEPGSSHVATTSPNLTAGTTFTPDKYKKGRKIYTHMGFHPVQRRIGYAHNQTLLTHREKDPTPASASHRISSAYLRSAGDLKVESSQKSEPRTPNKTKPAATLVSLLNSSTRSTVMGKRMRGKHSNSIKSAASTSLSHVPGVIPIVRLPKRPARVKAVTYADILGSASFSGVRAATQSPITATDKDYFPNTTADEQEAGAARRTPNSEDAVHRKNNTSRGPEVHTEDGKEDFTGVEENKLGVKGDGVDSELKTSGLFLDDEGSGSGGFNMSDIFSTDATETQRLSEELDYLRISTGNISFKSMKLSHTEK